jgi:hypothetical protein
MRNENKKRYRVELVNVQTTHARCGFCEADTLAQAQNDALRLARDLDSAAMLSECGQVVYFAGGINS